MGGVIGERVREQGASTRERAFLRSSGEGGGGGEGAGEGEEGGDGEEGEEGEEEEEEEEEEGGEGGEGGMSPRRMGMREGEEGESFNFFPPLISVWRSSPRRDLSFSRRSFCSNSRVMESPGSGATSVMRKTYKFGFLVFIFLFFWVLVFFDLCSLFPKQKQKQNKNKKQNKTKNKPLESNDHNQ